MPQYPYAQIYATDKQIDVRVYELYGLTEEEIAIMEAGRDTLTPAACSRFPLSLKGRGVVRENGRYGKGLNPHV